MNVNTGETYPSRAEAIAALAPTEAESDIVEIVGTPRAIGRLRMAARQANKRREVRRRMQKASRRRNR